MRNLVTTLIGWLHHRRWLLHGLIVLFWAVVFLLPYVLVEVIPSHPAYLLRPLLSLDFGLADALARERPGTPPNPNLVFLGIDDASTRLDVLDPAEIQNNRVLSLMTQRWPWPREIYAALLDRLCDSGARLVIFDILFTANTGDDPLFKASLDRHADKVIVGCNFIEKNGEEVLALPSSSLIPQTLPLDPRTAFVNFWPDPDGVFRHTRFHRAYTGAAIGEVDSKVEIDSVAAKVAERIGQGRLVPRDDAEYLFRYTDLSGSFQPISVYQVFDPQSWEHNFGNGAFFKDKIVMVGPSGNFQQDEHPTPLILHLRDPSGRVDRQSHSMDGAEIHLQALNALLHQEFLFYSGDSLSWMILLVVVNGLAAWVLLVTVYRAATFCALALAFYAIYFGLAFSMFSQGFILAVGAPLGTFFASTLVGLSTQYILEQIERARTRRTLEQYVSRDVAGQLLDNPAQYNASLVGRRREIAVLFSDLRGFTAMTENANSEQLVRQLNEYFSEMTQQLFAHKGILDKFIGDAVMAVWGSFNPEPAADAANAVRAALGMIAALGKLNVHRRERGLPVLGMGVGIHHGEAVVGDIGTEDRKNFTAIGDTVNLASRLEGVTKEYGVELVISETVEQLVRPLFHLQALGFEVVKGRQKPVGIFTVLGAKDVPLPEAKAAYLAQYEAAMKAYFARDFAVARAGFAACIKLAGQDTVSEVFITRCHEFEESPPPENWDGAHRMTRK